MARDRPRPWVWWVRVRDVPEAPASFVKHGNGPWWGWWDNGHAVALHEAELRRYGFERCYCPPAPLRPAGDCPAHGRELQTAGGGMDWEHN